MRPNLSVKAGPALALAALLFLFGCLPSTSSGPEPSRTLAVSGAPEYIPADGSSCLRLSIRSLEAPSSFRAPRLQTDLGTIQDLTRISSGQWAANLCAGAETGKVHFQADGDTLADPPSLYFIPPADYPAAEPVPVADFTVTVDPLLQTVTLSSADVLDAYSIALSIHLYQTLPFLFDGETLGVGVEIAGTNTPWDLLEVRAVIAGISRPGVALTNPDGLEPKSGGLPYYDYGGFLATDRAAALGESPSSWVDGWFIHFRGTSPFTLTGTVRVRLPTPADAQAEFRIRPFLSMAANKSMAIAWDTDRESRSLVVYGRDPGCEMIATGTEERNRINENLGWTTPRYFDSFFHRVELAGLEPDTVYYYRVLSVHGSTPPETFVTAAVPGRAFSFSVISDTHAGTGDESHAALISRMALKKLDFCLHAGDMVNISFSESEWRDFFHVEAPLLKNHPIFPALGNHDVTQLDLFYRRYFHPDSPYTHSEELRSRMYSFDWGNSHFVSIDTNLPVTPDSPQYQWLRQDLETATRNPDRKFTFVFEHLPIYSIYVHGRYPDGQTYLEPLYETFDVDAVFSGHVHVYERSDVLGRPYLGTGGGGGPLRNNDETDYSQNPYYVESFVVHEYLMVSVGKDAFEIHAYDLNGNLFDRVHYSKP
jgi:predicted phosphodiesterase